jgi:hypothetical protein
VLVIDLAGDRRTALPAPGDPGKQRTRTSTTRAPVIAPTYAWQHPCEQPAVADDPNFALSQDAPAPAPYVTFGTLSWELTDQFSQTLAGQQATIGVRFVPGVSAEAEVTGAVPSSCRLGEDCYCMEEHGERQFGLCP